MHTLLLLSKNSIRVPYDCWSFSLRNHPILYKWVLGREMLILVIRLGGLLINLLLGVNEIGIIEVSHVYLCISYFWKFHLILLINIISIRKGIFLYNNRLLWKMMIRLRLIQIQRSIFPIIELSKHASRLRPPPVPDREVRIPCQLII